MNLSTIWSLYAGKTGKTLGHGAQWTGAVWLLPDVLELPQRRKKPTTYFVNSLADWAHESIVESEQGRRFLAAMFGIMAATPQHTYQLLTKRPERARKCFEWLRRSVAEDQAGEVSVILNSAWESLPVGRRKLIEAAKFRDVAWPLSNCWIGASVEDQATADERIPALLELLAEVRFISAEPLLGPIDFAHWINAVDHCLSCEADNDLQDGDFCPKCGAESLARFYGEPAENGERPDWIIAGGESGPKARPCEVAWIRSIVEQCKAAGTKCFVKQLGARPVVEQEDCPTCAGEAVDLGAMLDHEETCDYAGHDILDDGGGECTTCGVELPPCKACGPYHGRTPPTLHLADAKGGDIDDPAWPEDLRVREFPR